MTKTYDRKYQLLNATKVYDYIKEHGCSKRRFAIECGINPMTLSMILRMKQAPRLDTLVKISKKIGVPVEKLVWRKEIPASAYSYAREKRLIREEEAKKGIKGFINIIKKVIAVMKGE